MSQDCQSPSETGGTVEPLSLTVVPKVNKNIVDTLEHALNLAKDGYIHSLAIVMNGVKTVMSAQVCGNDPYKLLGLLDVVRHEVLTQEIDFEYLRL